MCAANLGLAIQLAGPSTRAVVDFQRLRTIHRQGLLNTKTTCGACAECDRRSGRHEEKGRGVQSGSGLVTISDRPTAGKPNRTGERTAFQERHRRKFPDTAYRVHTGHRKGNYDAGMDKAGRDHIVQREQVLTRTDTPRREQGRNGVQTLPLRSTAQSPSHKPLGKRGSLRSE